MRLTGKTGSIAERAFSILLELVDSPNLPVQTLKAYRRQAKKPLNMNARLLNVA
jgi:hypothetical protein